MPIHSLTEARPYDVVVYGASVAGVLLALHHAAAGRSTLLLNTYGFAGGAVTESLSCLQTPPQAPAAQAQALFGALATDPHYAFGEATEGQLLNPEVLKFALQHALESSDVTLLYHVKARALDAAAGPDGLLTLHLIGKEGEFSVQGRQVLDATDSEHLARLLQGGSALQAATLSLFTSALPPAADATIGQLPGLLRAERLADGRYWLSLALVSTGIHEPKDWPDTFGDLSDAYTVRRFWS